MSSYLFIDSRFDLGDDFSGGIYHGTLHFPKNYPYSPPIVRMDTPNGRFELNTKLCLSMSSFHPESWNPAWRIEMLVLGLISFMTDPSQPTGTGSFTSQPSKIRSLALSSYHHVKSRNDICSLFSDYLRDIFMDPTSGYRYNPNSPLKSLPLIKSKNSVNDSNEIENEGAVNKTGAICNTMSKLLSVFLTQSSAKKED